MCYRSILVIVKCNLNCTQIINLILLKFKILTQILNRFEKNLNDALYQILIQVITLLQENLIRPFFFIYSMGIFNDQIRYTIYLIKN